MELCYGVIRLRFVGQPEQDLWIHVAWSNQNSWCLSLFRLEPSTDEICIVEAQLHDAVALRMARGWDEGHQNPRDPWHHVNVGNLPAILRDVRPAAAATAQLYRLVSDEQRLVANFVPAEVEVRPCLAPVRFWKGDTQPLDDQEAASGRRGMDGGALQDEVQANETEGQEEHGASPVEGDPDAGPSDQQQAEAEERGSADEGPPAAMPDLDPGPLAALLEEMELFDEKDSQAYTSQRSSVNPKGLGGAPGLRTKLKQFHGCGRGSFVWPSQ